MKNATNFKELTIKLSKKIVDKNTDTQVWE